MKTEMTFEIYFSTRNDLCFILFTDVDQAVTIFKELESIDPFRLDNLDTYSNLLYVKEMRVELSYLAHRVVQVDKYRMETCCVIGMQKLLSQCHLIVIIFFLGAWKFY